MIDEKDREIIWTALEKSRDGTELAGEIDALIRNYLETDLEEMVTIFEQDALEAKEYGPPPNPLVCCCYGHMSPRCGWVRFQNCRRFGTQMPGKCGPEP